MTNSNSNTPATFAELGKYVAETKTGSGRIARLALALYAAHKDSTDNNPVLVAGATRTYSIKPEKTRIYRDITYDVTWDLLIDWLTKRLPSKATDATKATPSAADIPAAIIAATPEGAKLIARVDASKAKQKDANGPVEVARIKAARAADEASFNAGRTALENAAIIAAVLRLADPNGVTYADPHEANASVYHTDKADGKVNRLSVSDAKKAWKAHLAEVKRLAAGDTGDASDDANDVADGDNSSDADRGAYEVTEGSVPTKAADRVAVLSVVADMLNGMADNTENGGREVTAAERELLISIVAIGQNIVTAKEVNAFHALDDAA